VSAADVRILGQMWEELGTSSPTEVRREAAERWWDPEIQYVEDPRWPGSSSYRGLDQVIAAWNVYLEILGSTEMGVERIVDAGDEVVALVRVSGVSKGADVPFDHLWAYVCRLRDGKLAYQRAYWDPDEALAAAGVDSP
jgi:ketosteroid isomerase-like protein